MLSRKLHISFRAAKQILTTLSMVFYLLTFILTISLSPDTIQNEIELSPNTDVLMAEVKHEEETPKSDSSYRYWYYIVGSIIILGLLPEGVCSFSF